MVLKYEKIQSSLTNQSITNINDNYYLCKNDLIKLGRVKICFK